MKRSLYLVGAGKVDITPPLHIPYLGIRPRHAFFTGVHDRLYARSLYVSDGRSAALIVAADALGFSDNLLGDKRRFCQEVRRAAGRAAGVSWRNVMLAANHIHSSPETIDIRPLRALPGAAAWLETLQQALAASARMARENRFKAELTVGRGLTGPVARNRRNEEAIDEELAVLAFMSRGGDTIFVVSAACHPAIMQVTKRVSADYVGVLEAMVERAVEKTRACLFLQGACGDINPRKGCTHDYEDARLTGQVLAGGALKAFALARLLRDRGEAAIVKSAATVVALPCRPLPARAERAALRRRARAGDFKAKESLRRVEQGAGPFRAEIQAIRIGPVVLVGIPGEPFCELGLEIKRRAAPLCAVPVGYANGYLGYIAPPSAWAKGGYEVSCGPWSLVGPESHGIVLRAFEKLKAAVGGEKKR